MPENAYIEPGMLSSSQNPYLPCEKFVCDMTDTHITLNLMSKTTHAHPFH